MGRGAIPGPADEFQDGAVIDEGTLARTDSPTPGPAGFEAKGGAGKSGEGVADQIVSYARRQRGERVGDGECYTLVNRALRRAGAKTAADYGPVNPDADYVWGRAINLSELQPGDVIQFRDYRYDREVVTEDDERTSTTEDSQERPHHTAIVERVDGGGDVTVLEQNVDGSPVIRSQLFFSRGTRQRGRTTTRITVQGTVWFYRPEAR
jgi:hypothetical protein